MRHDRIGNGVRAVSRHSSLVDDSTLRWRLSVWAGTSGKLSQSTLTWGEPLTIPLTIYRRSTCVHNGTSRRSPCAYMWASLLAPIPEALRGDTF